MSVCVCVHTRARACFDSTTRDRTHAHARNAYTPSGLEAAMTHFVSLALSHERRGDFAAAAAEYVRLIMLAEAEAEEEEAVAFSIKSKVLLGPKIIRLLEPSIPI